ncbi:MAG: TonB-dependent receptor [Steroidobacteraceae bacterium]
MDSLSQRAGANRLAAAISAVLAAGSVQAAQPTDEIAEIIVTATRRAEDIQDVPLNIAALSGEQLQQQGITDLANLGRAVPGLYVIDQGKRTSNQIIVRGLNVSNVGAQDSAGNGSGDIVATYVGEIPLYIDLSLEDMQRVEVLLGPQGTLYGSGTMGGAIRYIPNRPQLDATTLTLRGAGYSLSQSDDWGKKGGFTFNMPLSDILAFRASLDYTDDPGYIDQPFLVRRPGVSNPQPNFASASAVAANLVRKNDTNYTETTSGRVALRGQPMPGLDINFTHYFQTMDSGGRNGNSVAAFGTGRYESANRYLEPNKRVNRLTALEITADLGFAELTSATAKSRYKDIGSRDQTDLLITLDYSYEAFPSFSAFTRDLRSEDTFNQELRLVSKSDGPFNWIGGLFYNKLHGDLLSMEFTPNYDAYLGISRPDAIEYIAPSSEDLTEKALYGEVSYEFTDKWQVTAGTRLYKYNYAAASGADFPLLNTLLGNSAPDEINVDLNPSGQNDSGVLYKLNTRYEFTNDLMGYVTFSQGYRIGSSNGLDLCQGTGSSQSVCASPAEFEYFPDKTNNYELGLRSQWLNNTLTINGSVYFIDWVDPQLSSATLIGSSPITKNGKGAESKGIELSFNAKLSDRFTVSGSYAHTKAELSADAPSLLPSLGPPGFFAGGFTNGRSGDRLPGSPENQATFQANYQMPLGSDWTLDFDYGLAMVGNIITKVGLREGGETLPGYTVHQAAATLRGDAWSLSLYSRNLFNKYAVTGVRSTRKFIQTVSDENGDPVKVRSYMEDVLRPREIGLRFSYDFKL